MHKFHLSLSSTAVSKSLGAGLLLFSTLVTSCGTIDLPEDPRPSGKPHKVTIHTRAVTPKAVALPIEVVAFAEGGQVVSHQRLTKAEDKLTLSLPEGRYRLVAFSGVGNYVVPTEGVTPKSTISQKVLTTSSSTASREASTATLGSAATALMRGEAEIEVGKKRNTVDILLGHTMSAVEFHLSQIPQDVEQVRVRLSSVYGEINWDGHYAQSTTTTLLAHRTDKGGWTTEVGYLFPTVNETTVATISLVNHDEERNYAYTLRQPLTAGTPYRFYGAFKAEAKRLALEGNLTAAEWRPWVEQNFSFGNASSGNGSGSPSPEQPSPLPDNPAQPPQGDTPPSGDLKGFPQVGKLWKGKFLVASVQRITADEADVMLLAKEQLEEAESAHSTQGNADDATRYALSYKEDGEQNWTIPTKEEAQILANNFHGDRLKAVNAVLTSVRATEIYDVVGKSKIRYLCDEGRTSFMFAENPQFRKGTSSGHSFVVRLVKHVRVKKQ